MKRTQNSISPMQNITDGRLLGGGRRRGSYSLHPRQFAGNGSVQA